MDGRSITASLRLLLTVALMDLAFHRLHSAQRALITVILRWPALPQRRIVSKNKTNCLGANSKMYNQVCPSGTPIRCIVDGRCVQFGVECTFGLGVSLGLQNL